MAKVKTIQEKRAEMERELERLTAFETIINKLERDMKWDFCSIRVFVAGKYASMNFVCPLILTGFSYSIFVS